MVTDMTITMEGMEKVAMDTMTITEDMETTKAKNVNVIAKTNTRDTINKIRRTNLLNVDHSDFKINIFIKAPIHS